MFQHAVHSSRQERPTKYVHYVVVESNYAQYCTSARELLLTQQSRRWV